MINTGIKSILMVGAIYSLGCTRAVVDGSGASLASQATYTFPTTSVNNPSTITVPIQNNGQTTATNLSATILGSSFSLNGGIWPGAGGTCGTSIPVNASCTIVLQFLPAVGGSLTGSVTISFFTGKQMNQWTGVLNGTSIPEGTLDPAFGSGGIVQYDFGYNEVANDVVIQPDNKLILYGQTSSSSNEDVLSVRLQSTGVLDSSYGTNGTVTLNDGGNDYGMAAMMSSTTGDLVGVGTAASRIVMESITANGTTDSNFGILGISLLAPLIVGSSNTGNGIAQMSDSRAIIVGQLTPLVGTPQVFVARVATDGFLDLSMPIFGVAGVTVLPNYALLSTDTAYSVAIQSNGQIIVVGSSQTSGYLHSAMTRLNSDGAVDTSFGTSGNILVDMCGFGHDNEIEYVSLDASGMILLSGYCVNGAGHKDAFVARYSYVGGSPDTSFGTNGVVYFNVAGFDNVAYRVLAMSTGKILVGGYSNNGTVDQFMLANFNANGTANTSFGTLGYVTTTILGNSRAHGMLIQPDGKIVLAGYSTGSTTNMAAARYYP